MNFFGLIIVIIISNVFAGEEIKRNTTAVAYDPGELLAKIFNANVQVRQAGYGLIKFEDQVNSPSDTNGHGQYGLTFDGDQSQWKFDDNQNYETNNQNYENNYQNVGSYDQDSGIDNTNTAPIKFQDDNQIEGQNQESGNKKRKRRRRRRKQRYQGIPGYPGSHYPGTPGIPGPIGVPQGMVQNPYVNPGYYRPPPQRPSLASSALSTITEALTSIALYDDYQCVPRLLCEAAGGGALGTGFLQSATGLQPLLTLLSAYNGISGSPLFVFGRAVFLGMTSKANPGTCRYAYPQCPTDPEQLVNYLNNHNGGFFRFFNAPQQQNQNLEQFYNQLTVDQNYGLYDPNFGQIHRPNSGYGFQKPNLYGNQQNYGSDYPYQYGLTKNIRFKSNEDSKIEKRIQNKPNGNFIDDDFDDIDQNSKWLFPDDVDPFASENKDNLRDFENDENTRSSRGLKFPDDSANTAAVGNDFNRKRKSVFFPGDRNFPYTNTYNYQTTTPPSTNDYIFDHRHNFYVKKETRDEDDGIKTIYVVRGNGDPNNPEIIKFRPGQTYPYN